MLLLLPYSSSSSSSVKLFTSTAQSPINKVPSFLLPCSSCLRRTLTSEQSFFSSSSSSQRTSSPSIHESPSFSSSQHTSSTSLHKSPFFSSSQCTSSLSFHKSPFFSSSQHNSIRGVSFTVRCLSSFNIPSPTPVQANNNNNNSHPSSSYNSEVDDSSSCNINKEEIRGSIPVRAYFFSTSIDLKSLVNQNQVNFVPPTSPLTNHVVLRFGDTNSHPRDLEVSLSGSNYSYMVVFQYGSIVMFNIVDREVNQYLKIIERHASGLLSEMTKDGEMFVQNQIKYEVREKPNLPMWMQGGLDYIVLQYLNIDGVRMIGNVLGQSVALDYYVRQVDGLLAEFTDINRGLVKTGTFSTCGILKLRKLIRDVDLNLVNIDDNLQLFKRPLKSEIAWEEDAKYSHIWEYLEDKFELPQRFAGLDFMLRLGGLNTNFIDDEVVTRRSFLGHLVLIFFYWALFLTPLWDKLLSFIFSKKDVSTYIAK